MRFHQCLRKSLDIMETTNVFQHVLFAAKYYTRSSYFYNSVEASFLLHHNVSQDFECLSGSYRANTFKKSENSWLSRVPGVVKDKSLVTFLFSSTSSHLRLLICRVTILLLRGKSLILTSLRNPLALMCLFLYSSGGSFFSSRKIRRSTASFFNSVTSKYWRVSSGNNSSTNSL